MKKIVESILLLAFLMSFTSMAKAAGRYVLVTEQGSSPVCKNEAGAVGLNEFKSEKEFLEDYYAHSGNAECANISKLNLSRVRLENGLLRAIHGVKAKLSGALMAQASLGNANLAGANLSRADIANSEAIEAQLSSADLTGALLNGGVFTKANLSKANLFSADLEGINLIEANLQGANLRNAKLINANLESADLQDSDLRGADLSGATLELTKLKGAKFNDKTLIGISREEALSLGMIHSK